MFPFGQKRQLAVRLMDQGVKQVKTGVPMRNLG
jgi:hypothetical protein